jgi:predicted transcriptional regulator of viral defense system
MSVKKTIIEKFKNNNGFLCSEEVESAAERYHINNMLQTGEIERLKRGVYILTSDSSFDERVLLSRIYPKTVFCLFSAWEYYELSTSIPTRHYLASNRQTKLSLIDYPPVQIHYWDLVSFSTGITNVNIDNNEVRIYDIEKSVCDAVKYRGKVGEDITIEVIKNYIHSKNRSIDKLMKYAKLLRIDKTMATFIKPII